MTKLHIKCTTYHESTFLREREREEMRDERRDMRELPFFFLFLKQKKGTSNFSQRLEEEKSCYLWPQHQFDLLWMSCTCQVRSHLKKSHKELHSVWRRRWRRRRRRRRKQDLLSHYASSQVSPPNHLSYRVKIYFLTTLYLDYSVNLLFMKKKNYIW